MPNLKKDYNQLAGQNVKRIESISDGVFAVALTLLVLDIHVPVSHAIRNEAELIKAFMKLSPKLLTYFMSFMTLGIFWTGQTVQYYYIKRSDRNLNWISLFYLMVVCLIPFTTAFLSEHFQYRFSIGLYWLNLFLLGAMLYIHWAYAYTHDYTVVPNGEKELVNTAIHRRIIISQSLYATGALLSFVNVYVSILVIFLIQVHYAFGFIRYKKKLKE